jgi:hypothetical protein
MRPARRDARRGGATRRGWVRSVRIQQSTGQPVWTASLDCALRPVGYPVTPPSTCTRRSPVRPPCWPRSGTAPAMIVPTWFPVGPQVFEKPSGRRDLNPRPLCSQPTRTSVRPVASQPPTCAMRPKTSLGVQQQPPRLSLSWETIRCGRLRWRAVPGHSRARRAARLRESRT